MYKRKSTLLKLDEVIEKHQQLIIMHCADYGLSNVLNDSPLIIHTISTIQKRKWFKKVTLTVQTITLLTNQAFLNFIIDEKGIEKMISVLLRNLHSIKEYKPITIGNKTVEDSGFHLQAVFNGLGWTDARTKMGSYFLAIEKGELYEMVKNKVNANAFKGIVEKTNSYTK
ncbi:hypothetical protein [Aquimarina algiphila]|uniref:hypothetical protein n=1 Tax=Aquimarina algiphila TaxID=2047982 RepID=UPI00232E602F|nr:hypothetical protein [Aquimarina algiphila]